MRRHLLVVSALLALGGCATGVYVPKLSEPALNHSAFEKDVAECNAEQKRRHEIASKAHAGTNALPAFFGLAGAAASYTIESSKSNPEDDYYKTPGQIIDECMTARGYKVTAQ